ncbi:hypothetical protein ACJIZ3_023691 [Penstemon smallii]|uniref:Uncharacterized protein n=1 Tax=Penstemon smallii TaxID=265156 RepID=A0ABD3TQS9_9LAMI
MHALFILNSEFINSYLPAIFIALMGSVQKFTPIFQYKHKSISSLTCNMLRNMHIRSEAKKLNDGWSFDENWFFTNLLLHESEVGNLKDMETPLFREFRVNGEPFHLNLSYIFDEAGVATFPKDLTRSPEWPIHVRDSEDDEKAVVC